MSVNLSSGAITKIMSGKCTENDLQPVLQVIHINMLTRTIDKKQWSYTVWFSDGSFEQFGKIDDDIFISNKLQDGDIVQLTNFQLTKACNNTKGEILSNSRFIRVLDYALLCSKCDIIGDPKPYLFSETPFVVTTTPTIPNKDHANSHHVEEPPTSKQNPSTSTQKCTSHSSTQNKKRKLQLSDDIILGLGKDISKLVSMTVEKTIEDGLGACYKKLGTLEEGVSKMMEKSKEVDVGFQKMDTLKEHVSKMTKLMTEKSKEVDVGFKKLETLEKDVSIMTRMMMDKNKEDAMGFKKMETLEENVSKMAEIVMDKNKEDDVSACFKKLETLEENVSKLTRMTMEKNKEDDVGVCCKKLETLEDDVSELTRMMMEKNKEDVVGFKKLETLQEDVSKLTRMMMEKNKEDDMGACIEKLDKLGWEAEDPLYDTALLLFGQSADYRNLWLHMKPESCDKWVKNAGSKFGLLD